MTTLTGIRYLGRVVDENTDSIWMRRALQLARKALAEGEVPVGAVVVCDNRIVGRGHNRVETLKDPTAHAEMIAITAAADTIGYERLDGCTMYVTLEPCTMCSGALVLARVNRLVFGAEDPKAGACGSLYNVVDDARLNHRVQVTTGVMKNECGAILTEFFRRLRREKNVPGKQ